MSVSAPHALAVWRRNASMYRRTWMLNILPNFFEPVFYLLSIGIGVGAVRQPDGRHVVRAVPRAGTGLRRGDERRELRGDVQRLRAPHFEKAYDAMLTTPIEPDDVLVGEVLWAVTRATIYGGCFFLVLALGGPRAVAAGVAGAAGDPARRAAVRGDRHRLLAARPDDRAVQLLLHAVPDAALPVLRRLLPAPRALPGHWLLVAEVLPLLHPVRLARTAFHGAPSLVVLWDLAYVLGVSAALLWWARGSLRRRLTS